MQRIAHTVQPVYDSESKILILGSMLSPKSRDVGFYYGHPQNRFWTVLSQVLHEDLPISIDDKIFLLKRNHIALWDVLASCEIKGADDSSIKNPVANDLSILLEHSNIKSVFTTGAAAFKLYETYCYNNTQIHAIQLLSTSPANCRFSLESLILNYEIINEYLNH